MQRQRGDSAGRSIMLLPLQAGMDGFLVKLQYGMQTLHIRSALHFCYISDSAFLVLRFSAKLFFPKSLCTMLSETSKQLR